ncbi:MAG: hypothetical protein HXX12_08890 [Geothrix sp.]|uniref:hypothetical protein n=1 Tax=Geothrix sp. TaxID=1962974 RepID=UPI001799422C|nr:hypothetical protein [Geothrix sp.]NWJ41070.1 hypothetical protein [Geothrix sp.]WIL20938.1 MAG: hypothetical protein QOZ81_000173 [Geothrix sp.]
MPHSKILKAIRTYAHAYAELQHLQDTHPSIPGGDQKTGCIGEYYAYLYLAKIHGVDKLRYGSHSEKGWDIEIAVDPPVRIQVKTVSGFSKTRTISPIHRGWDQLFIVYLSRELNPEGFWIIENANIFGKSDQLTGLKCCHPSKPSTGSASLPFGENRVNKLQEAIEHALGA